MNRLSSAASTGIGLALFFAGELHAQNVLIDFNDPCALSALSYTDRRGNTVTAARYTFVPGHNTPGSAYIEDGMKFLNGVIPPDPALGPIPQPEYHLSYENPLLNSSLEAIERLPNPENEGRRLAPHVPGATIQLTYDPDRDGVLDRFNLISLDVLQGQLNVGVKSPAFGIAVYNDLSEGFRWFLIDATNLTRATLELPRSNLAAHASGFTVDNIVFQPVQKPPPPPCPLAPVQLQGQPAAGPRFIEPVPLSLSFTSIAPPPQIDVKPRDDANVVDFQTAATLAVAVVTTAGFDATRVAPATAQLGPGGAKPQRSEIRDVDGDGDQDLLLVFGMRPIGIQCSDSFLSLQARTFGGRRVIGADFINPAGCRDEVGS